jgi:hypothetical protein
VATLEEIAAKATTALTSAERDKLREILEFDATPDTSTYDDLETKVDALEGYQNQRARAYIDDWDVISVQPVTLDGGADAMSYSSTSHELQVRNRLRLLLGYAKLGGSASTGGIGRIPVGYACPTWMED